MKKIKSILCFALVFTLLMTNAVFAKGIASYTAKPRENTIYLYEEKNENSNIVAILFSDFTYTVATTNDEWTKIKVDADTFGYAKTEKLIILEGQSETTGEAFILSKIIVSVEAVAEEVQVLENIDGVIEEIEAIKEEAESYYEVTTTINTYIEEIDAALDLANNATTTNAVDGALQLASYALKETIEQAEAVEQLRQDIVEYACSFVGVLSYKWGGTSLTTGADCSGFTMRIYEAFGYSIPRVSTSQINAGVAVSEDDIKVGDLIVYKPSGGTGHVAIYIGDGMMVHSPSSGKKVSIQRYDYRAIMGIRRLVV